jgi:hypothetical protein
VVSGDGHDLSLGARRRSAAMGDIEMRSPLHVGKIVAALALGSLFASTALGAQGISLGPLGEKGDKIINGFGIAGESSVALFHTGAGACTATLIGCSTLLTAARCVCTDPATHQVLTGAECAQRADLLDPADKFVFFHDAGLFHLASIAVHPAFVFGQTSDLAVLRLSTPVTGITPSELNPVGKPGHNTPGVIVGWGITEEPGSGIGIKRIGSVDVATCAAPGINAANHVCATLEYPFGEPGQDSAPCVGDFGGPLFTAYRFDRPAVLSGIASGGDSSAQNCLPVNHLWFADVSKDRSWIAEVAGSDLGTTACGLVPPAGGLGTSLSGGEGVLSPAHPSASIQFLGASSPPTARLRAATSSEGYLGSETVLYVKRGSPASPESFDCKSSGPGALGFCDVVTPPSTADWFVLLNLVSGPGGRFELLTNLMNQASAEPCVPSATTLCVDDQPGDKRFTVTASFETDAAHGDGHAIDLSAVGVHQGGLFWFFSAGNPELLVKVLNGCTVNQKFWVFLSAGTNVGVTVKVFDTLTGNTYRKVNPLGTPFPTIQDTTVGLPCS